MTDVSRYRSLPEAEGRVLLLIAAFSGTDRNPRALEGRVKLAKLDFLIRYPKYLQRVLAARNVVVAPELLDAPHSPIAERMIRYRFGPWDPSYYAVLGSLIGRGLVVVVPIKQGLGYRASADGKALADRLTEDESWQRTGGLALVVRRHLDLAGTTLMKLLYDEVSEMRDEQWNREVG